MFQSNWDIDSYRDESETDEQWELRRAFMTKWKNDFTEERLVCLAKLYINIEFLGCRYPAKVQELVQRLSEEISESHLANKKNRLSRFFVSASSAAEDRARGVKRKNDAGANQTQTLKKIPFVLETTNFSSASSTIIRVTNPTITDSKDETSGFAPPHHSISNDSIRSTSVPASNAHHDAQIVSDSSVHAYHRGMLNTVYGKLVLIARTWCSDFQNLLATAKEFGLKINCIEEGNGKCVIILDGKTIASGTGFSSAEAKVEAASKAWKALSSKCITLVHKKAYTSSEQSLVKGQDMGLLKDSGEGTHNAVQSQFGSPVDSSIAMKMMKVMGWEGGALGATSSGITQPIMPNTQQVRRAGLGSNADFQSNSGKPGHFSHIACGLMQRFASNENSSVTDLIFSTDFSKDERALLHMTARKAGLTSRSYGKDPDRFLVVRKPSNPLLVVEEVIRNGGSTEKYQVIIPDSLLRS